MSVCVCVINKFVQVIWSILFNMYSSMNMHISCNDLFGQISMDSVAKYVAYIQLLSALCVDRYFVCSLSTTTITKSLETWKEAILINLCSFVRTKYHT